MMNPDAQYWIERLNLVPHPEGGFFSEVYRSNHFFTIESSHPAFHRDRVFLTSIFYLLQGKQFSAFHRLIADETWHFYQGSSPILLHTISPEGKKSSFRLGPFQAGTHPFQLTIPAQTWFAAELADPSGFALTGCTVAPGFEFEDLEWGSLQSLGGLLLPGDPWTRFCKES